MHHWHASGDLESERRVSQPLCAAGVCSRLGGAKRGAGWLLVKQRLWWTTVEQPQKDATFWDSIANTNTKSPRRWKDSGLPGPCRSPCSFAAETCLRSLPG